MRCDLIIRDATILDGTGSPRSRGDVAVRGDRIAGVGDLGGWSADRELEAQGLAVAPGFIDAHTHDDRAVLCGPECMLCKMSQGVTTVVVGNCGISLSPTPMRERPIPPLDLLGDESWFVFDSFAAYAERLARDPAPVNTVALIGHMSLRVDAMQGRVMRAATDAEAARMQARLAQALDEGASGFSTGLYYPANHEAPTSEVIAVAEALRARGSLYVTHMRDEGVGVLDSIEETLGIGRAAGVPVVISHHKCANPENYGRSATTLAAIDAGAVRQTVAFDCYPYAAGSTVLMPEKVRDDVPARITWSVPHPEMVGRSLSDIAAEWGVAQVEAARRLLPGGCRAVPDGRDGCATHPVASARHDRLGRIAARFASASAALGHVPSRAGPLRARPRSVQPGDGGPQDDRAHGGGVRPGRSRRDPRRRLCRSGAVRSEHGRRHRDL